MVSRFKAAATGSWNLNLHTGPRHAIAASADAADVVMAESRL